jgi:hypothetical protein
MKIRRATTALILALSSLTILPTTASASSACDPHLPTCVKDTVCAVAERVLGGRPCGI